jgi:Domain of unknown function (DUF4844)
MIDKKTAILNLNEIKIKDKFKENLEHFYSDIPEDATRVKMNIFINVSIDDFLAIIEADFSEIKFQKTIEKGLIQFDSLSLDTEDRERVCLYYEELMDAIGLESSGGVLNKWMYGFDV